MAVIHGTRGPDTRNGTEGNDTIYGWALGDNANSPSGNDTLNGATGNDKLYGGTGDDSLNGGLGSDTLYGSIGNDIYVVNTTTDSIIEDTNGEKILVEEEYSSYYQDLNIDTVKSLVSYKLGKNLENLTLTGTSAKNGRGNALNNTLSGNGVNNSLYGGQGNDYLDGRDGNDKLYGEAGRDYLDGGTGFDTLVGGTGNDSYKIDSLADIITEYSNQGTDTIQSSVSYTLGNNLENLTLTGTTAINGIGNALANTLRGNSTNNSLYGGNGNDTLIDSEFYDYDILIGGPGNDYLRDVINSTLIGNAGDDTLSAIYGNSSLIGETGNDTYIVETNTDFIIEDLDAGVDTVDVSYLDSYTLGDNLENLTIRSGYSNSISAIGNALDNIINIDIGDPNVNSYLFGDAGNDYLSGGGGAKTIDGGTGNDTLNGFINDTLTGGTDADIFSLFKLDSLSIQDIDTITDFSVVDDTISISADGFGGGLTAGVPITAAQFKIGSAASDASDRFIYNKNTGALFFDSDGIGGTAQVQFASLSTGLAITNADISVT